MAELHELEDAQFRCLFNQKRRCLLFNQKRRCLFNHKKTRTSGVSSNRRRGGKAQNAKQGDGQYALACETVAPAVLGRQKMHSTKVKVEMDTL